ncbi:3'-phosphoesterase [bacterium]|nr:3'-phosphoesterase [bacterium]
MPIRPKFVLQKHYGKTVHFDLRLEMNGVLRSWALPNGFPDKEGTSCLATASIDHPLEYGEFEGWLPEGEFGSGKIEMVDKGYYSLYLSNTPADQNEIEKAYLNGRILLKLDGEHIKGNFSLVQNQKSEKRWLLSLLLES